MPFLRTIRFSLRSKRKREGKGRGGGGGISKEKRKRHTRAEERRERNACNQSPHNSMYLRSKSGRKMLIGRDMPREAVSYSLAVRLANPPPHPFPFPFVLAMQAK